MSQPYLFVERLGGLLQQPDQADTGGIESLRLQPGCISALRAFQTAGFRLVVIDDPGTREQTADAGLEPFVRELFASEDVLFDAVLGRVDDADTADDCVLPGIELVADFIADPEMDRKRSIVVGNRPETARLARNMGLTAGLLDDARRWSDLTHQFLNQPRQAEVRRSTRETDILVSVDLDRAAEPAVSTGIGFFDHMLEQLGKHGGFALNVDCQGDLEVDEHHTVEDVALAVGQALRTALGDKLGIARYGFLLPMDEAETRVSLDLSGRAWFVFEGEFPRSEVGGLPTELVSHFFRSLAESLGAALHLSVRGENAHHMVEACFKGVARTLRQAIARSGSELPSTKGAL